MHGDPSPLPAFSYFSRPLAVESGRVFTLGPHVMSSTMIIHSSRNVCSFYPLLVAILVTLSAVSIIRTVLIACSLQSLVRVLFDIEGIMQAHLLPYDHMSVVYPVSSEFFALFLSVVL